MLEVTHVEDGKREFQKAEVARTLSHSLVAGAARAILFVGSESGVKHAILHGRHIVVA